MRTSLGARAIHLVGATVMFLAGSVTAGSATAAADDDDWQKCPGGYVCFFQDADWEGAMLALGPARLYNLTRYNMDGRFDWSDQPSSWVNRRSVDARWWFHINARGTSGCMASGARDNWVDTANDEISSIRIYGSKGHC